MSNEKVNYDFSNVPYDIIKEVHRQGELCLQQTVQLAIASDQRASTLTGILGAGAVALVVFSGNMASAQNVKVALVYSALATAFVLFVAALRCAQATRSVDYFVAGYEPKLLVASASNEAWLFRCAAEDIQNRIDHNRCQLEKSSRMLTQGRAIASAAVPVGAIFYLCSVASQASRFF